MNDSYWSRFQRERITRRRALALMGAGASGEATTPTGAPKHGGRYQGSVNGDWGTIDPVTSVGNATGILPRMYNVLINRSNANPDVVFLDLAEAFEQVDAETYVFTIRSGVKIAPNSLGIPERDLDVQDAVKWIERIRADKNAVARAFTEQFLASAEATGPAEFTMKTTGPYAYFVTRMGRALGGCIPPREFFEQGISLENQGVGAGAYVITSFEDGGNASFDRNPNYYRKDDANGESLPYIDGIDVAHILDRQARRTAFLDKQIFDYGASTVDEANELLGSNKDLYVVRDPAFTFISFTMNPQRDPWKDERIRKAALHALDRQQFVDLIVGNGEGKPNGLVHWPTGPFALDEAELDELQSYDPKQSRELIKAATGQDTIRIKVTYPISDIEFHDQHLPIFLKQMKEAGFEIDEDPKDFTGWLGDYTTVNYDASLSLNQIYETSEIALDWHSSKGPQGDGNFAIGVGILEPSVDAAILASKRASSLEEHVKLVQDAQRLVYEKGPAFLPIFSWYGYTMFWNFVKNVPQGLGDTGTFMSTRWLDV
jgi:ABC-type transport system substrate-binding protein